MGFRKLREKKKMGRRIEKERSIDFLFVYKNEFIAIDGSMGEEKDMYHLN